MRADWLLRKNNPLELAKRLRNHGVPVSEVFSFLSALYFRGKLAYAQAVARPPADCAGIFIITPTIGLVPHDMLIRVSKLRAFRRAAIDVKNRVYCSSLRRSARQLVCEIGSECEVVLLGSIASGKYLKLLDPIVGPQLRVPAVGETQVCAIRVSIFELRKRHFLQVECHRGIANRTGKSIWDFLQSGPRAVE